MQQTPLEPHETTLVCLYSTKKTPIFLICPKMEEGQARNAGWHRNLIPDLTDTDRPWDMIASN